MIRRGVTAPALCDSLLSHRPVNPCLQVCAALLLLGSDLPCYPAASLEEGPPCRDRAVSLMLLRAESWAAAGSMLAVLLLPSVAQPRARCICTPPSTTTLILTW
jgi:hypothetical protein